MAVADLTLDTANPDMPLLQALLRITDAVPDLRIVIDHLPGFEPKDAERGAYAAVLHELGQHKGIFIKFSNIEHRINHILVTGLEANRARMDLMLETFGDDRVMFASNYPQSVGTRTITEIIAVNRAYLATKTNLVAENILWRNAQRFYKWQRRKSDQPTG